MYSIHFIVLYDYSIEPIYACLLGSPASYPHPHPHRPPLGTNLAYLSLLPWAPSPSSPVPTSSHRDLFGLLRLHSKVVHTILQCPRPMPTLVLLLLCPPAHPVHLCHPDQGEGSAQVWTRQTCFYGAPLSGPILIEIPPSTWRVCW